MLNFNNRHFRKEIILMLIRWYLAYSLSYRHVEELALERGIEVDHTTMYRWVTTYSPQLEENFRKKHKKPVGGSWRCDETYLRSKGKWVYLYRAVDKEGNTIDFMLSKQRNRASAQSFFAKSLNHSGLSHTITIDKSGANKAGIEVINLDLALLFMLGGIFYQIDIRQIKYLNNMVEADHRFIKKITKPMMGFKSFESAKVTIEGIELHHMLRKGQHINADNMTLFEQFQGLAA